MRGKTKEGKTRIQVATRLAGYSNWWIKLAGLEPLIDALRDRVLVEKFLLTCSNLLSVCLRGRDYQKLDEVASKADLFLKAQTQTGVNQPKADELSKKPSKSYTEKMASGEGRKVIRCFLFNKVLHKAEDCRSHPSTARVMTCWNCGKTGHRANGFWRDQTTDFRRPACGRRRKTRAQPR